MSILMNSRYPSCNVCQGNYPASRVASIFPRWVGKEEGTGKFDHNLNYYLSFLTESSDRFYLGLTKVYRIYSRVQPFIWATTYCHAWWGKISCQWNQPYKNSIILAWEEQAYLVTGSLVQDKLRSSQKCTRTLVRKETVKKQDQIEEEGPAVISPLSSHNVPAEACLQVTEAKPY